MTARLLVEAAQRGDHDAFAALVRQSADRLYGLAFRILRDPHLAEDAVQGGLLTVWRKLPTLRDPDRFDAWATRLVVYACYAEHGRRRRIPAAVRILDDDGPAAPDDGLRVEDRDALERGFRRLPLDHRAVFVLHHHLGISLVEIAETLGIPSGTARSRLHYATRALRESVTGPRPAAAAQERSA